MRILKWIIFNAAYLTLLYFFVFEGVDGAGNIVKVWTYTLAVLSLCYVTESAQKQMKEKGRTVWPWLCVSIDLIAIASFLWFGYILLGCAIGFHSLMLNLGYAMADRLDGESS